MTLTQTAVFFRRVLAGTAAVFVLFLMVRVGVDVYFLLFPKHEVKAPVATSPIFGKLPPLAIKPLGVNLAGTPTLQLDLVSAQLPTEPTAANVYQILRASFGFLSPDRAMDLVRSFKLDKGKSQNVSATEKLFTLPDMNIRIDLQSSNFTYQYDYSANSAVLAQGQFTSIEAANTYAVDAMEEQGLLGGSTQFSGERGTDLRDGPKKTRLLRVGTNGLLESSPSLQSAQMVRVDFFRKPFDDIPMLSPYYNRALVNGLFTNNDNQPIMELNYTYWVVNRSQGGSYPLRSSQNAWEELQTDPSKYTVFMGNLAEGALAKPPASPNVQSLKVKKVYLAYYEPLEGQNFLQPMWVFEGKARLVTGEELDWVSYLPAIDSTWIQPSSS